MSGAVADACPSCGAPRQRDDRFCEACGTRFGPSPPASQAGPPCVGCGGPATAIGPDGYCTHCGFRQPQARDHQELDLGLAAGVTDRGLRHGRNEDALFLETVSDGTVVAVVCDGVSCSAQPGAASRAAADAAGRVLATAVASGAEDLAASMADAIDEAQAAVVATPWTPGDNLPAPSSTLVSVVCYAGKVTIGWVGDSRAYWLGSTAERLTADDSWAEEKVEAGLMTEAEADADPRAHGITAWLGADAPEGPRHVATFTPEGSGRLLVCSDGLWNYVPTATGLAELAAAAPDDACALAVARSLTHFALAAGGRDNITVVIVDLAGSGDGAKGAV